MAQKSERSGEGQQDAGNESRGQMQNARRTSNDTRMAQRSAPSLMSPFALLDRLINDELTSLFRQPDRDGGLDRQRGDGRTLRAWVPKIDVVQRGHDLVVRADLPGVDPDDIEVEIGDDAITISGERQEEHKAEDGGTYRLERSYGAFMRTIPLPEGAMVDQAKASFKEGVLEISVPAPPEQVSRGRRLDISRGENIEANRGTEERQGQHQR
jgi:HSP20 family protein